MIKMSKRKGHVSNFLGIGGLKGRDGLLLGVKWLFFSTLGKIASTVMSYPIFFYNFPLVQLSHCPNLLPNTIF